MFDIEFDNLEKDFEIDTPEEQEDFNTEFTLSNEYVVKVPSDGNRGDILTKKNDGGTPELEWVTPADHPEADNTRPITAAAVYLEIGNINALLGTI